MWTIYLIAKITAFQYKFLIYQKQKWKKVKCKTTIRAFMLDIIIFWLLSFFVWLVAVIEATAAVVLAYVMVVVVTVIAVVVGI